MGLMRFNFRSQAIGRYVDVSVVYPTDSISYYDVSLGARHHDRAQDKPFTYMPGMKFQTVYLIHGGGDDDSLTYRYTNVENYAQRNCVMLVTPDISNSFGVNTCYAVDYSTFLTEELPVVVRSLFASSPEREDNFIVGYAMGGNVALGTALMRPDLYSACIDISGGIGMTVNPEKLQEELRSDHFRNGFRLYCTTFGDPDEVIGSRFDMRAIAQKNLANGVPLPDFHFSAGSLEGFIGDRLKADADTLIKMGYNVTYRCVEGYRHDFEFWDIYLKLAFDSILPLKRKPVYPNN